VSTAERRGAIIVTFEYPPFPGGIGTYAAELAAAVRDRGRPVVVVAPSYPELPPQSDPPGVHRVLSHHRVRPAMVPALLGVLRRAPEAGILLAADIRSAMLLYLTRALHGRRYRVMVHGSEAAKSGGNAIAFAIARRAYLAADLVAYNSRATAEIFRAAVGTPAREAITHLGVDQRWFQPAEGGFEHPDLAALPDTASIFCSVGRVEPRKGSLEAVQAIARATAQHGLTDPAYVVAGHREDPAYAAAVEAEAARLHVRVVFTGRLGEADVKRLYRRSVCHLLLAQALPGKIEGFGLVLVEAAAQGCPTVATPVGGIPEALGGSGALVSGWEEAAAALAHFARNGAARNEAGTLARQSAAAFTWSKCADETFPELA
jgi:phosphatidylinositol alpha-1,6-mannosyltransferase